VALWTDPQIPELGPNVQRAHGRFAAAVGRFMMGIRGWRVEGEIPDIPKMVLIVAPHTSNWDFLTGVWVKIALRMGARFVGKHTLFRWPMGLSMRWLGGLPVIRSSSLNQVEQTVNHVRASDGMVLALSPEGTRKKLPAWRTGFYYVAKGAGIPIVPVAFDYSARTIRIFPLFQLTDDVTADIAALGSRFRAEMALRPAQY